MIQILNKNWLPYQEFFIGKGKQYIYFQLINNRTFQYYFINRILKVNKKIFIFDRIHLKAQKNFSFTQTKALSSISVLNIFFQSELNVYNKRMEKLLQKIEFNLNNLSMIKIIRKIIFKNSLCFYKRLLYDKLNYYTSTLNNLLQQIIINSMSKSNRQSGLGKALRNKIQRKKMETIGDRAPIFFQQTEQNDAQIKKAKLKSVITQNSLEGFLHIAQLSQQDFHANRDIKFSDVREQMRNKKIITGIKKKHFVVQQLVDQQILHKLQLPRKPDWKNLNKQQLQKKEAQAYLTWRRSLAMIQQKNTEIQITPYEKNIEVWKQLWRVVQRSDAIIQIVDGRDPLFFRSQDLFEYIKQVNPNKKSLLLINKSDLVSKQKIAMWNEYLIKNQIDHIFFSAIQKLKQINQEDNQSQTTQQSNVNNTIQKYLNSPVVLSIQDLIDLMNLYAKQFKKQKIQIGMVGYPNVGKSSVINSVFGAKKVAVASMPGKTKHFQTLYLTNNVTLCDCPGLVFPRISSSQAEMILNGLFPIDTLKNYAQAMQILALRIHKKDIQKLYALHWKDEQIYDGQKILQKYAMLKGFYTGNGLPNKSIAARHIIRDYINGILKYAKHPPGYRIQDQISEQRLQKQMIQKKIQNQQPLGQINMKKKQVLVEKQLDGQFFGNQQTKVQFSYEDAVRQLTEDDLLDIVEGRKFEHIYVTKEIRKQIKFSLKRGDKLIDIKKRVFNVNVSQKSGHQIMFKV